MAPEATRRTYTSVSATKISEAQAKFMCFAFRGDTSFQKR